MRSSQHSVSLGTFGLAFAVVLSPAFMQTSTLTCAKTGDTTLSTLEVEVDGQDYISIPCGGRSSYCGFDPEDRGYDVGLPITADTAIVRAYSTDPAAQVMYNYSSAATGPIDYGSFPIGGGEITLDGLLVEGASKLRVSVKAPGGASGSYVVSIHVGCSDCAEPIVCKTGWCDSTAQVCFVWPVSDGAECDFHGLAGVCLAGDCIENHCVGVSPCDDGDVCTVDRCDPLGDPWCIYSMADGAVCDFSGVPGICASGECVDPTWGTAEEVGPGGGYSPRLAADLDGNVIAVWTDHNGQYDVASSRYTPGVGWGAPELIELEDGGDARWPRVAVDSNGYATAVWCYTGSPSGLWSNRYTPGVGWGTSEFIDGDCQEPKIVVDPGGVVTAVRFVGLSGMSSNRYTPGVGWGTSEAISATDGRTGGGAGLTVGPSGLVTAVWSQRDDSFPDSIWSNRYTPGVGWDTAEQIETSAEPAVFWGGVAVDATGRVTTVWSQSDGIQPSIWSNTYTPGSGWGTAALIEDDDAGHAGRPQVAVAPSGQATAVWIRSNGLRDDLWSNRYTPGAGWGTPELVETDDAGNASEGRSRPRVVADPNGQVTAVWVQSDTLQDNIWSNQYTPGVGWGTAEPIESNREDDAYSPHLVVDSNGNATAAWIQEDSGTVAIWSNRLESP